LLPLGVCSYRIACIRFCFFRFLHGWCSKDTLLHEDWDQFEQPSTLQPYPRSMLVDGTGGIREGARMVPVRPMNLPSVNELSLGCLEATDNAWRRHASHVSGPNLVFISYSCGWQLKQRCRSESFTW